MKKLDKTPKKQCTIIQNPIKKYCDYLEGRCQQILNLTKNLLANLPPDCEEFYELPSENNTILREIEWNIIKLYRYSKSVPTQSYDDFLEQKNDMELFKKENIIDINFSQNKFSITVDHIIPKRDFLVADLSYKTQIYEMITSYLTEKNLEKPMFKNATISYLYAYKYGTPFLQIMDTDNHSQKIEKQILDACVLSGIIKTDHGLHVAINKKTILHGTKNRTQIIVQNN